MEDRENCEPPCPHCGEEGHIMTFDEILTFKYGFVYGGSPGVELHANVQTKLCGLCQKAYFPPEYEEKKK